MPQRLLTDSDCALIVVDVQEKLLPVISGKDDILANCVRLAKFAAIAGLPVIACCQQKLGNIVPPLAQALPEDLEAIEKISFDCFGQGEFGQAVLDAGRKTLVVCGIEAHICVAQTTLSALAKGYGVHVIADAVGSRTEANLNVALDRLAAAGAVVSSTEMFIYEVLKKAGTDQFKQVLPLVK